MPWSEPMNSRLAEMGDGAKDLKVTALNTEALKDPAIRVRPCHANASLR